MKCVTINITSGLSDSKIDNIIRKLALLYCVVSLMKN